MASADTFMNCVTLQKYMHNTITIMYMKHNILDGFLFYVICSSLAFVCQQSVHIISYHTSASGIRKNIALLHPISNKVKGRVGYGTQTHCFPSYSTSARVTTNFSSSLTCNAQSLKIQNLIPQRTASEMPSPEDSYA